MPDADPTDIQSVLVEGPWSHRLVSANGARFHVAELGRGPLVILLHGFPQFWYAWRHQLVALAGAGYRAVAMDLRGYAGSDKPPRGYDTYTGCADTAAVIRALGEEQAVIVGLGLGGIVAWTMPTFQSEVTRAIAAVSMPHPRVLRRAVWRDERQRAASEWIAALQRPFRPEQEMTKDHSYVEGVLRRWSSPFGSFPTPADVERYGDAMAMPFVAHSAAEHYRWLGRSQLRPDGPMFNRRIRGPVQVPVLSVIGTEDRCVLPECTDGSQEYVAGPYTQVVVEGAGHFLPEEAPERLSGILIDWLRTLP